MYTIEIVLKSNSAPLGVMQKEEDSANQIYQTLTAAIQQGQPQTVEVSCEKTGRKLTVLTQEIAGIQITPKAGAASSAGVRTGFVAQITESSN